MVILVVTVVLLVVVVVLLVVVDLSVDCSGAEGSVLPPVLLGASLQLRQPTREFASIWLDRVFAVFAAEERKIEEEAFSVNILPSISFVRSFPCLLASHAPL